MFISPGGSIEFKFITALDYDANNNLIYQGTAYPSITKASAGWRIKKFTYTSGNLTDIQFADGNDNYDNVWNDRAIYTYS